MSPMPKSVSLILPATDETNALRMTVERTRGALLGRELQFLVVTSPKLTTPECRAVISGLVEEYGAAVVPFDQIRAGIGGAIRDAFDRATGDYVVLMASDLETDPAVLPTMIAKLDDGFDIAATSRWIGGARFRGYDPLKLIFNFFFQHLFRILYWTDLTDLTYAYRAYRRDVITNIRWEETRFPFLFETIVKPLRLGYRVAEVPAPWVARTEGVSHNSFKQTFDYFWLGIRVRLQRAKEIGYSGQQ